QKRDGPTRRSPSRRSPGPGAPTRAPTATVTTAWRTGCRARHRNHRVYARWPSPHPLVAVYGAGARRIGPPTANHRAICDTARPERRVGELHATAHVADLSMPAAECIGPLRPLIASWPRLEGQRQAHMQRLLWLPMTRLAGLCTVLSVFASAA